MYSGDHSVDFSGTDFNPRLKELYKEMDVVYKEASFQAGFNCEGCDGTKCCTVDLVVHTFAEMLYMRRGVRALDQTTKLEIEHRCGQIVELKQLDSLGDPYRNSVCAANIGGRCAIYDYRPMICRLAGIPHFIDNPNKNRIFGTGCPRFETDIRHNKPEIQIDRTMFYRRMAELELEMIYMRGARTKRLTISEILSSASL